jgi:hypothetical protein
MKGKDPKTDNITYREDICNGKTPAILLGMSHVAVYIRENAMTAPGS